MSLGEKIDMALTHLITGCFSFIHADPARPGFVIIRFDDLQAAKQQNFEKRTALKTYMVTRPSYTDRYSAIMTGTAGLC